MYMGGRVGRKGGRGVCGFGCLVGMHVLRPDKYLNMCSLTAVALAATHFPPNNMRGRPNRNLIYRHSYDKIVS